MENANKKIKTLPSFSKLTLTCVSMQTIGTQNMLCFVWSTSFFVSCNSDLQDIQKKG